VTGAAYERWGAQNKPGANAGDRLCPEGRRAGRVLRKPQRAAGPAQGRASAAPRRPPLSVAEGPRPPPCPPLPPGKYSLHFHLARETTNAYLKNNAVYNSNWRCMSVHGTNGVYLYGNVGFNVPGHCAWAPGRAAPGRAAAVPAGWRSRARLHAHAHTHPHARTHTHTCAHNARSHARTCTHPHTYTTHRTHTTHTTHTRALPPPGYYLEDGVEERNVFERNLAVYVHPINAAGSGGGQQGTDRWASATLFDPTDSSAPRGRAARAGFFWRARRGAGRSRQPAAAVQPLCFPPRSRPPATSSTRRLP
jgi:hypothetical protein